MRQGKQQTCYHCGKDILVITELDMTILNIIKKNSISGAHALRKIRGGAYRRLPILVNNNLLKLTKVKHGQQYWKYFTLTPFSQKLLNKLGGTN